MNTKLVTSVTVMVLLMSLASHSLMGSAFALDAKGLDNKTKTETKSMSGASDTSKSNDITKTQSSTNPSKAKSDLPHAMTKKEMQKINREKQIQDESAKNAKDKAKAYALIKASQDKAKADSKNKSKEKTSVNSKTAK